ncbi:MAG TPA: formylmethanofuran dehydrogenase subunit E family protein [Deltaproteobacteria bacterium]|nr:formylmethanofuran dehydrogenase subunit E family protein [Deltaproteobacteria bacterium]
MKIGPYEFEAFVEKVRVFHGSVAPGIIAGGIMVDIARDHLPEGGFFDAICETGHCLPDAVQLLTPCTIGNRWLKIVDTSRYALALYNKYTGEGIRVFLDARKLDGWPAIRSWFLKERPKKDQDPGEILDELRRAGRRIFSTQRVRVKPEFVADPGKERPAVGICPACGEAYRKNLGDACPACRGKGPYL